jgi:hypothetical protein
MASAEDVNTFHVERRPQANRSGEVGCLMLPPVTGCGLLGLSRSRFRRPGDTRIPEVLPVSSRRVRCRTGLERESAALGGRARDPGAHRAQPWLDVHLRRNDLAAIRLIQDAARHDGWPEPPEEVG